MTITLYNEHVLSKLHGDSSLLIEISTDISINKEIYEKAIML